MRPISLTIEAFGPFRESVTLDFNALQDHSMFLISGPTGAGKTSILDAMVYALYGDPSGEVRKTDAIRSDFAEPTRMTRVDFSFAIGDAHYRVERLPKQMVAKKRGTGMREQSASATVYEMKGGEWKIVATSASAIRDAIQRIIGFRKDQFLQVVLLPQGEFRKLLVASTSEREELLHTLFRTELYRRLQDALQSAYDEAKAGIEDSLTKQTALLQSIPHDEGMSLLTIEHVRELLKNREPHRKAIVIERNNAVAAVERLHTLRSEWALYEQAQQSLAEALEQLELIKKQDVDRIRLQEKVQFLQTLTPTYELYKQYIDRQGILKNLEHAVSEAKKSVAEAIQDEAKCKDAYTQLESQAKSMDDKRLVLAQLQQQSGTFDELDSLVQELNTLHRKLQKLDRKKSEDRIETQRRLITTLEDDLGALRKQLHDNAKALDEIPTIQGQLTSLYRYTELLDECKQAQADMTTKHKALAVLGTSVKDAKVQLERLEHLMQEGRAFELSHLVEDQKPCPVCGSMEHPQLASKPDLYPTDGELEAARTVRDGALQRQAIEQGQKEMLEARLQELSKQIKEQFLIVTASIDNVSEESIVSIQNDLQSKLEQLTKLRGDSENLENTIADREQKLRVIKHELVESEGAHAELIKDLYDVEIRISSGQANFDSLSKSLPITDRFMWRKQMDTLAVELNTYDEQVKVCKSELDGVRGLLNTNRGRVDTLSVQVKEEIEHLDLVYQDYIKTLQSISLSTDDFEDALGDLKKIESYTTDLHKLESSFNTAQAVYDAALKQAQSVVVPSDTFSDIVYAKAVEERDALVGILAAWDKETQQIETTLVSLEALDKSIGKTRENVTFLSRLNDLANGGEQGFKNVTFERYVLGAILDEVVYAANIRLQKMSRSRYTLERSDYTGGGRGKQGLDLAVMDAFTGQSRPANTLSGGETFLASMALALGLADVIQSYAGGIHMDTIFIDEGFGTLDPDTLDLAMETLMQLQSSGRLIGLISHVPDLKTRIPAHLEVNRSDDGSTAQFVIN